MEAKISKCKTVNQPGKPPAVWFELPEYEYLDSFKKLEDKTLDGYIMTIKKPRAKSITANAYMWQLCDKIAKKIGVTKEDVYRRAVKEVGAFTDVVIRKEDAVQVCVAWESNGVGWFVEKHAELNGMVVFRLYQGSSLYDGEQMRYLVDFVVDEAKEQGIETMTPNELARLKSGWS